MGPLGDSLRYKECAAGYVHVIEHLSRPSGHTRDGAAQVVGAEYPKSRLFDALAPVKKSAAKNKVANNKAAKARTT